MKFGYTSRLSIFGLEMECEIKVLVWICIWKTVFLVWKCFIFTCFRLDF